MKANQNAVVAEKNWTMIKTTIISDNKDYPILLHDVKEFLRIYNTDQDNYINNTLIPAAVTHLENSLNRSLTTKTVRYENYDLQNPDFISLPYANVDTITSITNDAGNDLSSEIEVRANSITIDYNNYTPTLIIEYSTITDIDGELRQNLLTLCSSLFNNRNEIIVPVTVQRYINKKTRVLWL